MNSPRSHLPGYWPRRFASLIAVALALTAGCARNPATGRPDFVLMSEKDEQILGYKYNKEVRATYARYENPELQEYVKRVGKKLADSSHRPDVRYRFTVIDSPEVNAFALPAGYIFITRGLMAYLNSEAELAAVLGHEIAHVTARHAVRQHSLQKTAEGAMVLGSLFVPSVASLGQGVYGLLGGALFSGYGRDHELEADEFGAEYLARAGYDPSAMIDVIGVLKDQELYERERAAEEGRPARVYHGVFASHPSNDKRLQEAVASAAESEHAEGGRVGRRDYLEQIDGLTFGRSSRQGILHGRDFHHQGLGIGLEIPLGWRVENASDRLLAIAPEDRKQLQVQRVSRGSSLTPKDFVEDEMHLESFAAGQEIRVNGLPAYTAIGVRETSLGRRSSRFVIVFLANQAFVFDVLAEREKDQSEANAELLATANSFRLLTPEERDLAGELRIRLRSVTPQTSYENLLVRSRIPGDPEAQLRLLNGDYPDGGLEPGSLIKVVE